jgi:hypothetical protein
MIMTVRELRDAREYSRWDSAVEMAHERGLDIVLPREREAFIDIDTEDDHAHFRFAFEKLAEACGCACWLRPSPSGRLGRYHAVVRFRWWREPLSAVERIAIQAALGSDRKREALDLVRLYNDEPQPSLFFERPAVAAEVEAESDGWEAGCDFARDEAGYDAEHGMASAERRRANAPPPRGPWWVNFANGHPGACFEGTQDEARVEAEGLYGPMSMIRMLPYPREPRPGRRSAMPSLCTGGSECLERSSCPQGRACSE